MSNVHHHAEALALRAAEALEVAAVAICRNCETGHVAPARYNKSAHGWTHFDMEINGHDRCHASLIRAAFAARWPEEEKS